MYVYDYIDSEEGLDSPKPIHLLSVNPRLTKGVVAIPLTVFPAQKNPNESFDSFEP